MTDTAEKLTYRERKFLEEKLEHYPDNKKLVEDYKQKRADVLHKGRTISDMPRGSGISNPTEDKVIKLEVLRKKIEREMPYVEGIDDVLSRLERDHRQIVEMRYFERWLTVDGISQKVHLSRQSVYNRLDEFLMMFAERMGHR